MKEMKAVCLEMHINMETILPSDLTLNILSRLPADSVLQCRQVLKTWKDLLRQPSYPRAHLLHQLSQINGNSFTSPSSHTTAGIPFGLLFFFSFTLERGNQLYYGEYDNQTRNKIRKINQPLTVGKSVIGSCNGLICFSENYPYHVLEPSYVSNPITGEYVTIPRIIKRGNLVDYSEFVVCGFGYHPSTDKYKIVKIHYTKTTHLGRVVYTIGSGSGWRETGTTTHSLRPKNECASRGSCMYLSPFGTLANGALHWLNKEEKIVSFDLAKENVYLLPSPPFVPAASDENCFQLQVLGGCLCFVHEKRGECLDIWFLRKTGESNSFELNEQDDYELLTWIKEFSIPIEREAEPCALTNSGELLMRHKGFLFCYNPKTAALEKLMDNYFCYVLQHVNSFVSLKALGERRCSFRKRYDVNPAPKEIFIGNQQKDDGPTNA
ncbi:F-box protein At3g07870-like [Papaver somniferum]|uniref:F-box protein At3g07870-like n=1 Tax=Papaver somniferum TaxID=3469 RepID=UPI000E700B15|nr:F-box protein At3g07870-like [Papaver somniferum]